MKYSEDNRSMIEHFSMRSSVYNSLGLWVNNEEILNSILELLPYPSHKPVDIIDLGAGTGVLTNYIYNNYASYGSITAVDISSDMLSMISNPKINKVVSSVEQLPFDSHSFDVAVSRQCFHYVENLDSAIVELKRVLRDDGHLIFSQIVPLNTISKEYWRSMIKYRQPLRKHYFDENEWIECFKTNGFCVKSIKRLKHRSSVMRWAKKYKISDDTYINGLKNYFHSAPKYFLNDYDVSFENGDIQYNSFWFIALFDR